MTSLLTLTPTGWHAETPELVEAHLYRAGVATPTWPDRGESVALLTETGERIVIRDDHILVCPPTLLDAVLAVLVPEMAMT